MSKQETGNVVNLAARTGEKFEKADVDFKLT